MPKVETVGALAWCVVKVLQLVGLAALLPLRHPGVAHSRLRLLSRVFNPFAWSRRAEKSVALTKVPTAESRNGTHYFLFGCNFWVVVSRRCGFR